ncbi:hypothetical protein NL676_000612 [Syzygium grande]|nr:hypothetical protein NL676_000612 [Syzygium grande]
MPPSSISPPVPPSLPLMRSSSAANPSPSTSANSVKIPYCCTPTCLANNVIGAARLLGGIGTPLWPRLKPRCSLLSVAA